MRLLFKAIAANAELIEDEMLKAVYDLEQELNGKVANELYTKYGIGLRFHIDIVEGV